MKAIKYMDEALVIKRATTVLIRALGVLIECYETKHVPELTAEL